jgi:hypothetical protein
LYEKEDTFFAGVKTKNVEEVSNRDMRIPVQLHPGGYFGQYNPDGGDLGRGNGPDYDKAVINTVHLRYASEYTKKAEWSTDSARKAIVQTVKKLTAESMVEMRRAIDCLYHTAGDGVLATISAVSGSGPYDLTCDDGIFGVKLLRYGQKVNVFDSTLGTNRTSAAARTITAYNLEDATVTISGSSISGIVAGDVLVVEGATTTPPVSLLGIPYHANDETTGSWLGFNRATTPEVVSSSVDAAGASLALPMPRLAVNKVGNRLGKDKVKGLKAFMHPCQKQNYESMGQLVSIIQKQANSEKLDLYFGDMMQMAGAPVVDDFKWDMTRIDFMNQDNWGRCDLHPIDFYSVGNQKLFAARSSDGGVAAAVLFYIVMSTNAFVDNPAELVYIKNLAVPTGYRP